MSSSHPIAVGVTGASGAIYALRLLHVLRSAGQAVQLCISPSGAEVLYQELGTRVDLREMDIAALLEIAPPPSWDPDAKWGQRSISIAGGGSTLSGALRYFHYEDFLSPMASGSAQTAGMVVCPCSGGTASAIAHGASDNLIARAADVHLKEGRKLILVPRETPLSLVHLSNLRRCAEAGATVLPAMPGFYHGATSVLDLVDFVVARICDQLGIQHNLSKRWGDD